MISLMGKLLRKRIFFGVNFLKKIWMPFNQVSEITAKTKHFLEDQAFHKSTTP
jgi:hypothetical protein